MKIGIDISQTTHGTGVGNYVSHLVEELVNLDKKNSYVLFFSSLRGNIPSSIEKLVKNNAHVSIKTFSIPPTVLDILWNILHIAPIEWFIGPVDVFITSDWTEPPAKAPKMTIVYDFIVYKYPQESHNQTSFNWKTMLLKPNIVSVQKRKLAWVVKESKKILCISEATRDDAIKILKVDKERINVIYAGVR